MTRSLFKNAHICVLDMVNISLLNNKFGWKFSVRELDSIRINTKNSELNTVCRSRPAFENLCNVVPGRHRLNVSVLDYMRLCRINRKCKRVHDSTTLHKLHKLLFKHANVKSCIDFIRDKISFSQLYLAKLTEMWMSKCYAIFIMKWTKILIKYKWIVFVY